MDEAEALRRERERAQHALDRAEEKARARADKDRRSAEREAEKRRAEEDRRRRDAERDEARRRSEAERQVAEAEREASQAQREAARAAADAVVAERRAQLRLEAARARAERAGLAPAALEGLPPGFGPMWRTADVVRRGPRPGLTVAEIVEAGIRLADAEGLGALSMARVAEAVGVTTMALYRYVGGKDELVAAMFDAAMGRPPGASQADVGWRAALTAWSLAQLDLVRLHPWVGETVPPMAFGPNRLAWLEAGLAALDGTPLDWHERTAVVGRFALHVLGETQTLAAGIRQQAAATAGGAQHPALIDYGTLLTRLADPDAHPAVAAALAAGAFDDGAEVRELGGDMQDFGLRLLLDGVEALIVRAQARRATT